MAGGKTKTKLTKSESDAVVRGYRLLMAAWDGAAFESDGVTIDFHCELDPAEWRPVCPPGFYGDIDALHGPGIIFPWTPPDWRAYLAKQGPVVEAPAGSRVFISAVVSVPIASPFEELEHPANRGRWIAFMRAELPGGQVIEVPRGLVFLPTSAIASRIDACDWSAAYRGMLDRMEAALGVEDIEEVADQDHEHWPKLPPELPRAYGLAFLALRDREKDFEGHAMAAFGYMLARAEAEERLLTSARRGVRAAEQARRASSAKAAKDRAASEPIRARAAEIIAAEGTISLTQCARRVARELDRDERWVARTIKELFEKRAGRGEYRPKPVR